MGSTTTGRCHWETSSMLRLIIFTGCWHASSLPQNKTTLFNMSDWRKTEKQTRSSHLLQHPFSAPLILVSPPASFLKAHSFAIHSLSFLTAYPTSRMEWINLCSYSAVNDRHEYLLSIYCVPSNILDAGL